MMESILINAIDFVISFSIGFLFALPIMTLTVRLAWGQAARMHLCCSADISTFKCVVLEEIVWRDVPRITMNLDDLTPCRALIICLILATFFVSAHKVTSPQDFFERFLFTSFLYIGAILLPGSNYGMHFGRNILTSKTRKTN